MMTPAEKRICDTIAEMAALDLAEAMAAGPIYYNEDGFKIVAQVFERVLSEIGPPPVWELP